MLYLGAEAVNLIGCFGTLIAAVVGVIFPKPRQKIIAHVLSSRDAFSVRRPKLGLDSARMSGLRHDQHSPLVWKHTHSR
jgi:hypothetical protein